jgi:hypothetical protein
MIAEGFFGKRAQREWEQSQTDSVRNVPKRKPRNTQEIEA